MLSRACLGEVIVHICKQIAPKRSAFFAPGHSVFCAVLDAVSDVVLAAGAARSIEHPVLLSFPLPCPEPVLVKHRVLFHTAIGIRKSRKANRAFLCGCFSPRLQKRLSCNFSYVLSRACLGKRSDFSISPYWKQREKDAIFDII
jgi:hypothetical protein